MADLSDIQVTVARVESSVSHLNEKLDLMHNNVVEVLKDQQSGLTTQAERIRVLELTLARIKGGALIVASFAGMVFAYLRLWPLLK